MCSKVGYLSETVANNAVILHMIVQPECPGIARYYCDQCDAFHIGHVSRRGGRKCKANGRKSARIRWLDRVAR